MYRCNLFGYIFILFISSCLCQFVYVPNLHDTIKDELFLHNQSLSNKTRRDCVWRPMNEYTMCPDPDIKFILYSSDGKTKQVLDSYQTDWLRQSAWDSNKEDVFIIHGYAGGDDTLPIAVLRDAYVKNGSYNVWMVDWGPLSQPPCYPAAVHNIKVVGKCTADLLTALRNEGLRTERLMCVGHSLGAHTCGLISRFVQFRMHRIVALDPARPLIPAATRLNSGDAGAVHVIHTNAGHYGEAGRSGHVDFCVNGGKIQPYCENVGSKFPPLALKNRRKVSPFFVPVDEQLCSHVWAVCYMAESLHSNLARRAEPCSRRCPNGPRPGMRVGVPVLMGQFTPLTTAGSYCLYDKNPPYCPSGPGAPGDKRCCLKPPKVSTTTNNRRA